jgi:hypothetical protein
MMVMSYDPDHPHLRMLMLIVTMIAIMTQSCGRR